MYASWEVKAILEVAKKYQLVIISCERRTLPSSDGNDPIEDNAEFIKLMLEQHGIKRYVESHNLEVDRCKLVLSAESAGAMFLLQSLTSCLQLFVGADFQCAISTVLLINPWNYGVQRTCARN
jgi:hypothetical protein